jgi:hypothetical protein
VTGPRSDPHPAPAVEPEARERVVGVLTRLFADDRISAEDLEARLERVYHAATRTELEGVVADLQAGPPAKAESRAPAADAPRNRVAALFSGQEQRLAGVVPRQLEVRSRFGYVDLDLTGATFEAGVTEIDVRVFMGYAQIRFPAGVRVESRGHAVAGFFAVRGGGGGAAPSVIRLTGRAVFGFAECFVGGGRRKQALPPGTAEP